MNNILFNNFDRIVVCLLRIIIRTFYDFLKNNFIEKEINCTSRHLTHHFENSFWPSIPLELVTFENNSIVHLKKFTNVTINKLIFRHNKISKIDDNAFQEIRNLSQLDLSHNQLTSSILLPTVFTVNIIIINYDILVKYNSKS